MGGRPSKSASGTSTTAASAHSRHVPDAWLMSKFCTLPGCAGSPEVLVAAVARLHRLAVGAAHAHQRSRAAPPHDTADPRELDVVAPDERRHRRALPGT